MEHQQQLIANESLTQNGSLITFGQEKLDLIMGENSKQISKNYVRIWD